MEKKREYEIFVREQFQYFFDNFFEDASFSRRSIALESIHSILEHFNEIVEDLKTEREFRILLIQFHDSYEHNKQVTLNILKKFPLKVIRLDEDLMIQDLMDQIWNLTKSHKPPDSITAGYIAKYITSFEKMSSKSLIAVIFQELKIQYESAKFSLENAALNGPMYGLLFCLRSLLEPDVIGTLDSIFLEELFDLCLDITIIIANVLNR